MAADKTKRALEGMLDQNPNLRAASENELLLLVRQEIVLNPNIRQNILATLRGSNTAFIFESFRDNFKFINQALDNLSVGKSPDEVRNVESGRTVLNKRINEIVRKALSENFNAYNVANQQDETLLWKKIFTNAIHSALIKNNGQPIKAKDLKQSFFNIITDDNIFPPARRDNDFRAFFGVPAGTRAPSNLQQVNSFLTAHLSRPGSELNNFISAAVTAQAIWENEINRELQDIDSWRNELTTVLNDMEGANLIGEYKELVDYLCANKNWQSGAALPSVPLFLNSLGATDDERIRWFARSLNVQIVLLPNGNISAAPTIKNIKRALKQRVVDLPKPGAELKQKIQDAVNTLNSTMPLDRSRVLSKLVRELQELEHLFGSNPLQRIRSMLKKSPFNQGAIVATNPADDFETVRLRIENYILFEGTPTVYDARIARIPIIEQTRKLAFDKISSHADSLKPGPNDPAPTNVEIDNVVQAVVLNLLNTNHPLEDIAEALYLPPKSGRAVIEDDIHNKLVAFISDVRFLKHPRMRYSNTEVESMLIPEMSDSDKIFKEMMSEHNTKKYTNAEYRVILQDVLNSPANATVQPKPGVAVLNSDEQREFYLKFKEIAAKHGYISDIGMLRHLAMMEELFDKGYTFNLRDIANKGFDPNPLLKEFIKGSTRFEQSMEAYTNMNDYIRDRHTFLVSIPENQRSTAQNEEFEIVNRVYNNRGELNNLVREIAENYQNYSSLSPDAKALYDLLAVKYNPAAHTASSNFRGSYGPGASALQEMLANSYKSILALNTVFVPRIAENPDVKNPNLDVVFDKELEDLKDKREEYAKTRRKITSFFRRGRSSRLSTQRKEYLESSKMFILATIDREFPKEDFEGSKEEVKQRKVDMRNRVLELLNKERLDLFNEEMANHAKPNMWNKFRNGWRKHKIPRMVLSLGLLGGAIATSGTAALVAGGTLAGMRFLGGWLGWASGYEAVRNKFGGTKRIEHKKVKKMGVEDVQESMAAQTVLAMSEKGGWSGPQTSAQLPQRPVTDRQLEAAQVDSINNLYYPGENTTAATTNYRQETSHDLWQQYNKQMRSLIDSGIDGNKSMEDILDKVFAEESKLAKAIEKREEHIRKSNMKKHLTGVLVGSAFAVLPWAGAKMYEWITEPAATGSSGWWNVTPTPTPPPGPPPFVPNGSADMIIPEWTDFAQAGDCAVGHGFSDHPGILASLSDITGQHPSALQTPGLKAAILADNPQLGGNWNLVHTGDSIKIGTNALSELSSGTGIPAAQIEQSIDTHNWGAKMLRHPQTIH